MPNSVLKLTLKNMTVFHSEAYSLIIPFGNSIRNKVCLLIVTEIWPEDDIYL